MTAAALAQQASVRSIAVLRPTVEGVTTDMAVAVAESVGVCVRPILRTVTDRATGATTAVPIPCGSTRSSRCPTCADKARRLRMHQCREGWHLTDDPLPTDEPAEPDPEPVDAQSVEEEPERRTRSTRRRDEMPDLPTVPVEHRTVGRTFTDPKSGREFRPSMFITGTLPSYGLVIRGEGVPRHPARYDYRRAALDALLFPKLVDRTIGNLRRCAGYQVQYFGAVEAQKRLAPHLHLAARGAIPRHTIKGVWAGTYVSIWWPPIDRVVFSENNPMRWPMWTGPLDDGGTGYVDPTTGEPLPTWAQALDNLDHDEDAEPMHVLRWGPQTDIKGVLGGTEDADRAVRYLCKYLTKAVAETYAPDPNLIAPNDQETLARARRYEDHIDRLHAQVRVLPCSPACANWLRYGIQPKNPTPGLHPGQCSSKAHERECLGLGGRRALVSRYWTGKPLGQHKADRAEVVRQVLQAAGIDAPEADRLAADVLHTDGKPRFVWEDTEPDQRDYPAMIAASLRQAKQWRTQYEHAKTIAAQHGSPPDEPVDSHSAIHQSKPPQELHERRES